MRLAAALSAIAGGELAGRRAWAARCTRRASSVVARPPVRPRRPRARRAPLQAAADGRWPKEHEAQPALRCAMIYSLMPGARRATTITRK